MDNIKLKNSLIFFCNLAIPSHGNKLGGLGNLLKFEKIVDEELCPFKFITRNEKYLIYIFNFYEIKNVDYSFVAKKLIKKFGESQGKIFLEDFKVFAIKHYFSNPLVIRELSLIKISSQNYDLSQKHEDKKIIESLLKK